MSKILDEFHMDLYCGICRYVHEKSGNYACIDTNCDFSIGLTLFGGKEKDEDSKRL